jgi:hypothetical protein
MKHATIVVSILIALAGAPAHSQNAPPQFITLGDSIGEGVQSAEASTRSQPYQLWSLIAQQMGVNFPLPLIEGGPFASIFSTQGRFRINPLLPAANLSVSGATIHDVLNAHFQLPVDTEADLVLMPRTRSQMQIAETLKAPLNMIWIGNNDVDGTVLAWNQLDASQMTPVDSFTADYAEMIGRFSAWNSHLVVGTIPDVTQTGFVVSPATMMLFLGTDCGLPQGSFTSAPSMLLIKLGYYDCSLLQDPNYVLDPQETAAIQQRLQQFNQIMTADARQAGFGVVDIYGLFLAYLSNPPVFFGVPILGRANGGLESLDAFHPSNIGHALAANAFIQTANQTYEMNIPLINQDALNSIAAADPFIDWNGNLVVRGRPLAGKLETLGPFLGISGDFSDQAGAARVAPASKIDKQLGQAFKQQYLALKGLPASTPWSREDAMAAMLELFPIPKRVQ